MTTIDGRQALLDLMNCDDDERFLMTAVIALYRLNDSPGRHIITIPPKDVDAKWVYEFEPTDG